MKIFLDQVLSDNPVQYAFDQLGPGGSGILVIPDTVMHIPAMCTTSPGMRNLQIEGTPNSALAFANGVGGLVINMATPHGTEMGRDQVVLKDFALLTTQYTDPGQPGSGVAVHVRYETAVGDKTNGFTARGVQCFPMNHNPLNGKYQKWNAGFKLENCRNNLIDRCAFGGGSLQLDGFGVELLGGTVSTVICNSQFTDMNSGVLAHGQTEGVKITATDFVDCRFKAWLDGTDGGGHYISDVEIFGTHGSCVNGQVYSKWVSMLKYYGNNDQKREGTGEDYTDITLDTRTTIVNIHDNLFQQRGTGGAETGIFMPYRDGVCFVNVHDNYFINRDVCMMIGTGIQPAWFTQHHNTAVADVGKLIQYV